MLRQSLFMVLALSTAPLAAQEARDGDIVVTGKRLEETEKALRDCIARHCPVDEDVRATLAHAENLFVSGNYKTARKTLTAGIGRDGDAAKRYPVEVSSLYRASGRVAAHLGEGDPYRINTIDSLDALKAGLPDTDPRVLAQRIEVGDMFVRIGRVEAGVDLYRSVARTAEKTGAPQMQGAALLRIANARLREAENAALGSNAMIVAFDALDAVRTNPDPKLAAYAKVAEVMKAQVLARKGQPAAFDAIMADMRKRGGFIRPVLLDSRPIDLGNRADLVAEGTYDTDHAQSALSRIPVGEFEDQWIDVSFWIKPDGSVEDAGIVRQSERLAGDWSKAVLASVNSRRYAALALPGDDPGLLRLERYTYTSFFDDTVSGTRIRTRSGRGRVEMLDLTAEAPHARS